MAKITIGTNSTKYSALTMLLELVSLNICTGTTMNVIIEPKNETSWPKKSRR